MPLTLIQYCTPLELVWIDFLKRCEVITPRAKKQTFIAFVGSLMDYAPDALKYLDLDAVEMKGDLLTLFIPADADAWELASESLTTRLRRSAPSCFNCIALASVQSDRVFKLNRERRIKKLPLDP